MIGGSFQFQDRDNSLLINRPWISAPRRAGSVGMEILAAWDPCAPRTTRQYRAATPSRRESSLQVPSASAVRCWLFLFLPHPFLFFSFSIFLCFIPFSLADRSHERDRIRGVRARATLRSGIGRSFPEPAACVLRLWKFRGSAITQDSIFAIGDCCQTRLNRYEMVVHVILQRLTRINLNGYTVAFSITSCLIV